MDMAGILILALLSLSPGLLCLIAAAPTTTRAYDAQEGQSISIILAHGEAAGDEQG